MAADAVDRATCWALTSPGCGWCVGAFGDQRGATGAPRPPNLHTSDSRLTPDVGVSHTFTHRYANTCVPTRRRVCSVEGVCASVPAAKQSRLSVARGLWRQICLNAFIVSRGGRDAEGRCGLPPRTGTRTEVAAGPSCYSTNSRFCSPLSGEVKLQLLTSGRKGTRKRPLQSVAQG